MVLLSRFSTRKYALLALLVALIALAPQGAAFAAGNATHLKGHSLYGTIPQRPLTTSCVSNPSWTNCDRVDPYVGGCVDMSVQNLAQTILIAPPGYTGGTVYLRYSGSCHSGWSKLVVGSSEAISVHVERQNDGKWSGILYTTGSYAYSDMLYGPVWTPGVLRACAAIGSAPEVCTNWTVVS